MLCAWLECIHQIDKERLWVGRWLWQCCEIQTFAGGRSQNERQEHNFFMLKKQLSYLFHANKFLVCRGPSIHPKVSWFSSWSCAPCIRLSMITRFNLLLTIIKSPSSTDMMNTSVHHFPAYFDDVDAGRVIHCCMIHCIGLHSNQNQSKLHPSIGHPKNDAIHISSVFSMDYSYTIYLIHNNSIVFSILHFTTFLWLHNSSTWYCLK